MAMTPKKSAEAPWWHNPTVRSVFYQLLVIGGVLLVGGYLVSNTLNRLSQQSIATGFGFLSKESGFGIGESMIAYSPASTYGQAFIVGLLNTFKVGFIGIVLATVIGTVVGIARLSTNWLIAKLASIYVESLRNVPLLLQLFFWYALVTEVLPHPRDAVSPLPDVFLSNRGLMIPSPIYHPSYLYVGLALVIGIIGTVLLYRWGKKRQAETGKQFSLLLTFLGPTLGLTLLAWLVTGAHWTLEVPELKGFNFRGGSTMSPEFTALLAGLTFYTASFIAEIVRSGIQAVPKGQTEASSALGLRGGLVLRLVILPQALRVIIPPLTSQYLNLIKNSSLAVAIGYPDLVSIANTTLNQTGQAVEGIAMTMAVYLTISLSIAAFMNWYNTSIRYRER